MLQEIEHLERELSTLRSRVADLEYRGRLSETACSAPEDSRAERVERRSRAPMKALRMTPKTKDPRHAGAAHDILKDECYLAGLEDGSHGPRDEDRAAKVAPPF